MSLTSAKAGLKQLAVDARAVMEDANLTVAQKSAKLDALNVDLEKYQREVTLHQKSAPFLDAGSSINFADAAARKHAPRSAAYDYGWDGETFGGAPLNGISTMIKSMAEAAGHKSAFRAYTEGVAAKGWTGGIATKDGLTGVSENLPAQLDPTPILFLREPTRISSLFPSVPFPARTMEYMRVDTVTGNATAIAEGGAFPAQTETMVPVSSTARKIGTYTKVPDENLEDYSPSNAIMTDSLTKGVIAEENTQLLSGDGTGENLTGILSTAGILSYAQASGAHTMDSLRLADAQLRNGASKCTATAYVMSENDWTAITLLKDGYGRYLLGDPGQLTVPQIWGRPVVVTTDIPDGTVLAGDFQIGGAVGYRRSLEVEVNYAGDDFTTGMSTWRAYERLGLFVFRPSAFVKITLTEPVA